MANCLHLALNFVRQYASQGPGGDSSAEAFAPFGIEALVHGKVRPAAESAVYRVAVSAGAECGRRSSALLRRTCSAIHG